LALESDDLVSDFVSDEAETSAFLPFPDGELDLLA
jgi:hypothetical protein